jgi:hypothetical protein
MAHGSVNVMDSCSDFSTWTHTFLSCQVYAPQHFVVAKDIPFQFKYVAYHMHTPQSVTLRLRLVLNYPFHNL